MTNRGEITNEIANSILMKMLSNSSLPYLTFQYLIGFDSVQ